jgi:murein L,D-transpeptidase YcbB/YkuD
MQFIIFHPEWGVPDSIKMNEIAPKLMRYSGGDSFFFGGGGSSQVLERLGMRVSINGHEVDPDSVDWSSVDIRRFQFIQASGGRNVLGVVKFRFPNKHDVYMHDTPDKELFSKSVRAYSHGCMRTQNPVHLAEVLLAHDKGWSAQYVRELVEQGGGPNEIKLTNPIPVYVTYFTADVDEAGKVRYLPDLYGTDNIIISALKGKPVHYYAPAAAAEVKEEGRAPRFRRDADGYYDDEGWRYSRRRYSREPRWNPFGFDD